VALTAGMQVAAQVISGDLVGNILDKTGAVVPHAQVEATNVDTGVKYHAEASDSGEYRFNNLPVGTYTIAASATNFASTTVSGFKIELNKTQSLPITLEIKGATTQIEVSGVAATLDTTSAQLTSTFEDKQLADLPSASTGSGVLNLSLLSSGVASSGGVGAGAGPSVGGQRPRNNNFTIEGVDNNSKSVTGPLVFVPNDAVAEVSILQNQYSPEFGHSSGGQFNTVIKGGTNSFHGLAYIYNENRNYNALDTLQAIEGFTSNPRFDFNRIGGQVGGPILKNKLFFFVNFEYDPLGQAGGGGAVCSPTADGFATIDATSGLSATNVAQFEKYVTPGTLTGTGCKPVAWVNNTTIPTEGLAVVAPSYNNSKFVTSSIDYNISSSDQLRGRYIYNSVVGIDTAANLPAFFTPLPNKFHLVTINEYHTFSPTVTNEFRVGYNRFAQNIVAGSFSFPNLDSFPNLQINDLGQLQIGPDGNAPQFTIQNTYQAADAVTWTKGRHTLKFGIEGRKSISPQNFTQRGRGDYEYNNLLSFLQDQVPDSLAERSNGNTIYYGDQASIYWFANDNWRVRPNLTINLGLRYEYTTIPQTQRLQSLNSEASVPGFIDFSEPRAAKNNWGPRVGFAYSPGKSQRTSIRAGAGISYDVLYDNLGLLSLPPQLGSTIDCAPVGTFTCPTPFLANGGILPGPGGLINYPTPEDARLATASYVPVNQQTPKSIDWTLGVQHTFGSDYTLEVRYVGTRGIHLPTQNRLNAAPQVTSTVFLPTYTSAPAQSALDALPYTLAGIENGAYGNGDGLVPAYENAGFFGSYMVAFEPWGASTYHGLATQLTKKFSHGLQVVGAYTYSHAIDNSTADVFSTVLAPRRPQDFQDLSAERSNSILDHRHRLTLAIIYDLPYFKNSNNWAAKNLLGNWEFAPVYTYQSGQWVTAQSGTDSNLNGDSAPDRAILNPSGVKGTGTGVTPLCTSALPGFATCGENDFNGGTPGAGNFDSTPYIVAYAANDANAQYIQAGLGAQATTGRNTLQLKPINNLDLTAVKRFSLTERFRIEFLAQAYNALNHPQYVGGSLNDIASIGFTGSQRNMLIPGNSDFNNPSSVFASNARVLQLGLKLYF
jgi:hypothetical protein